MLDKLKIPVLLDNGTQITLNARQGIMVWPDEDQVEAYEAYSSGADTVAIFETIENARKRDAWFDVEGEIPIPQGENDALQVLIAVSFIEKPEGLKPKQMWAADHSTAVFKNYIIRSEVYHHLGGWFRFAGGKMFAVDAPAMYGNGCVTYKVVAWRELPTPPEGQVHLIKSLTPEQK